MKKNRMSYEEKSLQHIKEVDRYLEKHGMSSTAENLQFIIKMEISNLIFDLHSRSRNMINICVISIQILFMILSIICGIFGIYVGHYTAVANLVLAIVVIINNKIHTGEWNIAKKKVKVIEKCLDYMRTNSKLDTIRELQDKFGLDFNEMINKQEEENQ